MEGLLIVFQLLCVYMVQFLSLVLSVRRKLKMGQALAFTAGPYFVLFFPERKGDDSWKYFGMVRVGKKHRVYAYRKSVTC